MIISFCKSLVTHQKLCRENISLNFVIANSAIVWARWTFSKKTSSATWNMDFFFFWRCKIGHLFKSQLCHSLAMTSSKFSELLKPVPSMQMEMIMTHEVVVKVNGYGCELIICLLLSRILTKPDQEADGDWNAATGLLSTQLDG